MKPEQQRIAIAEACGWSLKPLIWRSEIIRYRLIKPDGEVFLFKHWDDGADECRSWETACARDAIPDYLNDLNAMNEAEKTLTDKQYDLSDSLAAYEDTSFSGWLFRIMVRRAENPDYRLYSASAAKRAEAFLRTIGKWEEEG
jgi:hypothetical protein